MHLPLRVSGRHFLMDDAGSGCHPLNVTVAEHAAVAKRIAMFDIALQDIGDGLDATMRVPGKAFQIFRRVVIPEIVHHQERIERIGIAEAKNAVEMNAGPLHRRAGLALHLDGAYRHRGFLAVWTSVNPEMGTHPDFSTVCQRISGPVSAAW